MKSLTKNMIQECRLIQKLLNEIRSTTEGAVYRRLELIDQLKRHLLVHGKALEESLFPHLCHFEDEEILNLVERTREEYELFEGLIERLDQLAPESRTWRACFELFQANVQNCLQREETKLVPLAEGVLTGTQAANLLERMRKVERDYLRSM